MRGTAIDALAGLESAHEETLAQADREIKTALTTEELVKKQLTAQCRELEGRKKELEGKLRLAREDYDAFCEKVGVN